MTTSLLLVAVGVTLLTRGGDDDTAAEGLDAGDQLTAVVAGPSDSDDTGDEDGIGRSGGAIGLDKDAEDESESGLESESDPDSTLEVTTTTVEATTTSEVETTLGETTTTTGSSTTVETTTTLPSSTTTTSAPETTVPETTLGTTSTTKPDITSTMITIRPTTIVPNHNITPKDLAAARKRWSNTGYDSYQMTVTRWCFCVRDAVGPFEVTVRRGEVTVRHMLLDDDDGVSDWIEPQSLTVPGLFNLIESSFKADGLNVVFDRNTGVPLTIEIDSIALAVDDELTIEVTDFRPLRER